MARTVSWITVSFALGPRTSPFSLSILALPRTSMHKNRLNSQHGQFHTRGPILIRGGPGTAITTVATLHFNVIGRVCIGFIAGRVPLPTTVKRLSQTSNEWELQTAMPPIEDLGLPENQFAVPVTVQVHFRNEFLDTLYCGVFHYTREGRVQRLLSA